MSCCGQSGTDRFAGGEPVDVFDDHALRYVLALGVLAATQGCSVLDAVRLIDLAVLELDEPAGHIADYVRRFGELP